MDLDRFIQAQELSYDSALLEIKRGKKIGHWMWYIFPQYKGLGKSAKSNYYAIQNLEEAKAYLNHSILGRRLLELTTILLEHNENDASKIFGMPDYLKFHSCMTLFTIIDTSKAKLFENILAKYFNGIHDKKTIMLINHNDI